MLVPPLLLFLVAQGTLEGTAEVVVSIAAICEYALTTFYSRCLTMSRTGWSWGRMLIGIRINDAPHAHGPPRGFPGCSARPPRRACGWRRGRWAPPMPLWTSEYGHVLLAKGPGRATAAHRRKGPPGRAAVPRRAAGRTLKGELTIAVLVLGATSVLISLPIAHAIGK